MCWFKILHEKVISKYPIQSSMLTHLTPCNRSHFLSLLQQTNKMVKMWKKDNIKPWNALNWNGNVFFLVARKLHSRVLVNFHCKYHLLVVANSKKNQRQMALKLNTVNNNQTHLKQDGTLRPTQPGSIEKAPIRYFSSVCYVQ